MISSTRKIIHIDMDAFYAAVEQRDHPHYRHKPVIVGGQPNSRGVVATCSYEARQFGIHSAMPSSQAYRLCPQAIFVKPRFAVYQEASEMIRLIFHRYCELIEPLSLDEAYLDVSTNELFQGSASLLARQIKQDIFQQTQLIASAGVSYNKFLAKIASDKGKPNGLFIITPQQGADFIEALPIDLFYGVGRATAKKMHDLGIQTGKDLKQQPLAILQQHFGKYGQFYYDLARGIDNRPVNGQRIRKSIGIETTFAEDIADSTIIFAHLQLLLQKTLTKLLEKNLVAYTLTIKIKYQNFVQITRGRTLSQPIRNTEATKLLIADLLKQTDVGLKKVRLLGITLSGLDQPNTNGCYRQVDLFEAN